jgi:hypothetical protein
MEIKPTYVTFEQAKLLPKEFENIAFACYYKGEFYAHKNILNISGVKEILHPINKDELFLAPEQWEIVEWLLIKHNIWVSVRLNNTKDSWMYFLQETMTKQLTQNIKDGFNSPQEAYSAAFDYVLNNLI